MFVQVVQARIKDAAGLEAALKQWQQELKPGAKGWLGTTSGTTKDGLHIAILRFDTEQNARANSNRPEQTAWRNEMAKNLEGEPTFFDSTEVESFGKGGSDKAGFVQIISGKTKNKKRMQEIDKEMQALPQTRDDFIGGTTAWNGDRFVSAIYFTSEKEARENEAKGPQGDGKALMEEMQELMEDVKFFDLTTPRLQSP